jgi:hypothetical protein
LGSRPEPTQRLAGRISQRSPGGTGVTGFNIDSVYSAGIAAIGAIILLALYHAFFRRRML